MNGSFGSNRNSVPGDLTNGHDDSRTLSRAELLRVAMKDAPSSSKTTSSLAPLKPGARFCTSKEEVYAAKNEAYCGSTSPTEQGGVDALRVEIAPGVTARLRGSKETFESVGRDFYFPTTCFCCSIELCVIMDASYVLCPACRVVSPLESGRGMDGGVGLGFTFDDLRNMQWEILHRRRGEGSH